MAFAAGTGFIGSSLVTDDPMQQCIAAGTAAALSTLLFRSGSEMVAEDDVILRLGDLTWTLEDVCRHFIVTGRTGSGKTAAGLCNILSQLIQNVPNLGGLIIDQKGLFFRTIIKIAKYYGREDDVILLQVRPKNAAKDWKAPYRINFLGDPFTPGATFAQLLIDIAQARGAIGTGGSSDHFASQAKIHMGMAIEARRLTDGVPTLRNIYTMLTSPQEMQNMLKKLRSLNIEPAVEIFNHFLEKFLQLAGDELSGVKSTITNALFFYQHPDIAEVFASIDPNVDISMTDDAKIFCISIPQRFETERSFINTMMKYYWFKHVKERFDLDDEAQAAKNLNLLVADEAQRVVTKNDLGMADHNQIDQLREAKGCIIYATQTERSFIPPLGRDIKNTFMDNIGNEIAFCQTNEEDAEILAKRIGQHEIFKPSYSVSKSPQGFSESTSKQEKVEYLIKPHVLRNQKKFHCVVRHCEKGYIQTKLNPTKFTNRLIAPLVKNKVNKDGQAYDLSIPNQLKEAGSIAYAGSEIAPNELALIA